ncbi:MAG: TIGR03960 family B12-binding radical SAM protein [Deltaproteobacteria bacterium]|nr:TIGR03960 family B12-binding radical SAM protein [Deltaproteobacteria bacterium]MBW2099615.1 TIGR03960 family B12-binding radical SAM protein [Deltaproteobacteria bacterium]
MASKTDKLYKKYIESEIGTIRKDWRGRIRVALVYPNTYHVGMSNLGFQTVYRLLNEMEHVVCERAFLPEDNERRSGRIRTIESRRLISDFDIIAFSISFENDYFNLLSIIESAGLPLQSSARGDPHPLIIAGGVACFINPEPIAPFIDCFLIGEAEPLLPRFFEIFDPGADKKSCLKNLAKNMTGIYVPAFYKVDYNEDGTLSSFDPVCDVPAKIKRVILEDLSIIPTCSAILTPDTTFPATFLIEVSRGCPHGCRFCSAGYIYRPPRFRPFTLLEKNMEDGALLTNRIGLVGAAVSDLPEIKKICDRVGQKDIRVSFSSLRADALSPELISALRQGRVKTATIAPEAGSERMRKVINKGITEEDIFSAAETLVSSGIPNLKLYFMIGLPTETMDDIEAIVKICLQVKEKFLESSRPKRHIGQITVSINSFVPKPVTPFQWVPMDDVRVLKNKIKKIKNGLKGVANIRVHADNPRWAYINALLSRGDRKVAEILSLAHSNRGNWAKTLKASPVDPGFYVHRDMSVNELLPWDFIDHGIKKSFLIREYKRAKAGRTSPPCPMDSCDACGVCAKKSA